VTKFGRDRVDESFAHAFDIPLCLGVVQQRKLLFDFP
jgi:hypothetical protein